MQILYPGLCNIGADESVDANCPPALHMGAIQDYESWGVLQMTTLTVVPYLAVALEVEPLMSVSVTAEPGLTASLGVSDVSN